MKTQLLLVFLTLVTVGLSEKDKRKTLIISVDESKPEQSSAVISDLSLDSLEGQPSAPVYRTNGRQYKPNILQSAPIDKQLGYILLTPEDLKRLQNLDGVSIEEPKHVTLPHTLSQDDYEDNPSKSRYPPSESPAQYHSGYSHNPPPESPVPYHSGYPSSPPSESHDYYSSPRDQKYPLRPAPPLSSLPSSNSSLTDHTSYDPPSSPKYTHNSQTSSQYDPYSSAEKGKDLPPYDSGSSYERSKYGTSEYSSPGSSYGTSSYSSPGSSYDGPREPSYEKSHSPPQVSYSSKPEQYDQYSGKNQESYSAEPYMYSGYKPPQTGSYSKYSSGSKPSTEYAPSHYKYPISPVEYSPNAKPYSNPSKYSSHELSPHSYSEVQPSPYDSNKKTYSNQSPAIYENTYKGESAPNNNIPLNSYGSRNKYAPESLPPSSSYSSKPHYNGADSGEYPPKESYSAPINKYKGYDEKPHYSPQYETPSKQSYYDGSKSSHSGVTGPSYQGVSDPSSDTYYYPPSSHSERSPYKGPSSVSSYDSPASYDNKEVSYTGKSTSKMHGKAPGDGSSDLPSYNAYGNRKYPVQYKHLPSSSEDDDYISSPVSPKSHSNYHGSSSPNSAVVTSFYENPSPYTAKDPVYDPKYPESHQADKSPQHTEYGPSIPPKYNIEDGKSTHYESPTFESDPSKDKSYYDRSRGREAPSKLTDSHSATKNYKPSRPAPLYDEYEQPRYPPLPEDIKDSAEKSVNYGDYKDHSGEKSAYHESSGKSYPPSYSPDSYRPTSSEDKSHSYYPRSKDSNSDHYSDHSSQEADGDPVVYTKTITKTYTKPQTDSPSETKYYGDQSSEDPYSSPNSKYSPSSSYSSNKYPPSNSYSSNTKYPPSSPYSSNSKYSPSSSYSSNNKYSPSSSYGSPDGKSNTYTSDSDSYSRPHSYSESPGSSEYTYVKPLDNGEKKFKFYTQNSNPESSPSYLTETQRPKRVEGVVYRTRKTYPKLQSPRRQKTYLPYKVYDPKYAPAFDHKIYENAPEQNVTKPPSKAAFKLKYRPLKKEHHHKDNHYSTDNDGSYEVNAFANIPGEAGKDFPILKEVPYTHFSCENRAPGFYADVENRCQVYYQCSDKGRIQSFLCPNGTIFNQATFVCEWWHNVDCAKSEKHFSKNDDLYKSNPTVSTERAVVEKYHRPSGHVYTSDDYQDNYRGDGNERISKYEKPLRKRRRNHSRVTYSSPA